MRDLARRLASIALLVAACASSRAPSAPSARPVKVLPRSSVAAVLSHRGELALDDRQIQKLEAIDDELQRNYGPGTPATPVVPGGSAPGEGPQPAGGHSARDEGRSADGGRHSRWNGGHGETGGKPQKPRAPVRAWDDADTAAYYRAEEILRPEQRERAREIAEQYREELYEQRAASAGARR